jgi:hypothetical protein
MTVFWDVAACTLVEFDRCFKSVYCPNHQTIVALMMGAVSISETLLNFCCATSQKTVIFNLL